MKGPWLPEAAQGCKEGMEASGVDGHCLSETWNLEETWEGSDDPLWQPTVQGNWEVGAIAPGGERRDRAYWLVYASGPGGRFHVAAALSVLGTLQRPLWQAVSHTSLASTLRSKCPGVRQISVSSHTSAL